MGLTIEDSMFIFGYKKNVRSIYTDRAKIQGENDWLDGKDSDANPYPKGEWPTVNRLLHDAWYKAWFECNKNC